MRSDDWRWTLRMPSWSLPEVRYCRESLLKQKLDMVDCGRQYDDHQSYPVVTAEQEGLASGLDQHG